MNSSPIGIMDSGIGGLGVLNLIKALLPGERLIYVADKAYCPYGSLPVEEIRHRCILISLFFLSHNCKMIVIACNTATAAAIETLRSTFTGIPVVGMEPAVKPAVLHTHTGIVGVLATPGTFKGRLYNRTLATFGGQVKVIERVGEGWVGAVERGDLDTPATREMVRKTIQPMLDEGVDHLVLGCTHYPFLIPVIRSIAGPGVVIVDPAPAVARRVKNLLTNNGLLSGGVPDGEKDLFYTSSADTSVLPKAVPYTENLGTMNWRPYTFENME
ncbi:MAG TPA: glutamate racemase [Bacteroidales bacterium]|jgi:glutamate racemase|nr:glutamate racemase [Bacteroidales bacterium]MCZ2417205.1 glutamate racemase [Burkholderiales bacterium]OQC57612.1 MAG: Glutamate racemase [Bacteroidetes bacterium ADurb.Bin013]MBP8998987.1 glutamate racemase [Bacteroidales bacterium]MBV6455283.1 Glutamate racemase [Bacteroidales bacterium]